MVPSQSWSQACNLLIIISIYAFHLLVTCHSYSTLQVKKQCFLETYPSTIVLLANRIQCSQSIFETGKGIRTLLETSFNFLLNCSNS